MKTIKKIIAMTLLSLALVVAFMPVNVFASNLEEDVWDGSISNEFAGGIGTSKDPYQISKGSQLAFLASKVNNGETYENTYFVLTSNINLNNLPWVPIGNTFSDAFFGGLNYYSFEGNLDGKGYNISNVLIGEESTPLEADTFGLFGAMSGKICNLNLNNVFINGIAKNVNGYVIGGVGSLVGFCNGSLENCHVENISINMNEPGSGYVAAYWIGGLVGVLDENQYIKESSVSGKIFEKSGKGSIGGFIGELGETAEISFSSANVELNVTSDSSGGADVGGFIGKGNGDSNIETIISNCYANGNVTGGSYSGGFAGSLWGLNIRNCYAGGNVKDASSSMASFVGTDASAGYAYGSIKNCYTTGKVIGAAAYKYAFAQQSATKRSEISNCYFLNDNLSIKNTDETAESKSIDEMKTETFKDLLNDEDDSNGWIYFENQLPFCGAEHADYTKVNEAKSKVPSDLTIYTDESVNALKDALASVEEGKNITEQETVDSYADTINKAIEGLVKKPIIYKVIEGEGGTFVKKSGNDISIRIDHEYTENVKVEVDGKEVAKTNYKVTKGLTIVTFNKEYLESLPVGNHEVKVYFEDGYATTTLIIKEQTKDNNEKKDTISNNQEIVKAENKQEVKKVNTGDNTNIVGITLLLVGSLIVLIYLNKKKTA